MTQSSASNPKTILLIGASRGLGLAIAAEFLRKGWNVVGTVRGAARGLLHDLAETAGGSLEIETLDIRYPDQIAAVYSRLSGRKFEMLFVNAGIANEHGRDIIGNIATDEFVETMVTNALSPMRVLDGLGSLVTATGLIGVMSSGRGSISNNVLGQEELYRGSKAALNMFMRSYAARHADTLHPMVAMAPGWVRTELGGPDGKLSIEESIPNLVNVLLAKQERPGLEYLDYLGRTIPW